jgi:hypothetical protein
LMGSRPKYLSGTAHRFSKLQAKASYRCLYKLSHGSEVPAQVALQQDRNSWAGSECIRSLHQAQATQATICSTYVATHQIIDQMTATMM